MTGVTVRAYCRVSTARQGESGLGLSAQREAIQNWARSQGLSAQDITWHVDPDRSGGSLDRPELVLLLDMIGPGDRLVVSRLDRLSRSVLDFSTLVQRSVREGWSVACLDLGLDLSTPAGRMVANVLASIAEWERSVIGERTSAALAQAKARGRLPGKRSALPRETQDLLVAMDDKRSLTLKERAAWLNERAIFTATGLPWTTGTIDGSTRSARLEAAARLIQEQAS